MEKQTQATCCTMWKQLRARARVNITTGRERTRFVSLQHQTEADREQQVGAFQRESHRQKGGMAQCGWILRKAVLAPVFWGPNKGRCITKALTEALLHRNHIGANSPR